MITELEKIFRENTLLIDELISKYFLKNLPKKDLKTATFLMSKDSFTFNQKIKLFCDLVRMSKLDKAKFKVFTKINYDLNNNDILNPSYFHNIRTYHTFLLNTYSTPTDTNTLQEKLFSATNRLSNNIVRLTQIYSEKPQIYQQKKAKYLFSR